MRAGPGWGRRGATLAAGGGGGGGGRAAKPARKRARARRGPSWGSPPGHAVRAWPERGPAAGRGRRPAQRRDAGGVCRGGRDGAAHLGFVQPLSEPVHHRRAGPARPAALPPPRCARARLRRAVPGRLAGGGQVRVQVRGLEMLRERRAAQTRRQRPADGLTRHGAPAPHCSLTPRASAGPHGPALHMRRGPRAPCPPPAAEAAQSARRAAPRPARGGLSARGRPVCWRGEGGQGNYKSRRASLGAGSCARCSLPSRGRCAF